MSYPRRGSVTARVQQRRAGWMADFTSEPLDVYKKSEAQRLEFLLKAAREQRANMAPPSAGTPAPLTDNSGRPLPELPGFGIGGNAAPAARVKKGGGFKGRLDSITPEFTEGPTKTAGRGLRRAGGAAMTALNASSEYGGPLSQALTGAIGDERIPLLDKDGNQVIGRDGKPVFYRSKASGGEMLGHLKAVLTQDPRKTYAEARESRDEFMNNPNLNAFERTLYTGLTDPVNYVAPGAVGAVLKVAPKAVQGGRVARALGSILESPARVSAGAIGGSAAGAQAGHEIGGPTGEAIGAIAGAFAGGGLASAGAQRAAARGFSGARSRIGQGLDNAMAQEAPSMGMLSERPVGLPDADPHHPLRGGSAPMPAPTTALESSIDAALERYRDQNGRVRMSAKDLENLYQETTGKPHPGYSRLDLDDIRYAFEKGGRGANWYRHFGKWLGGEVPQGIDEVLANFAVNSSGAAPDMNLMRAFHTMRVANDLTEGGLKPLDVEQFHKLAGVKTGPGATSKNQLTALAEMYNNGFYATGNAAAKTPTYDLNLFAASEGRYSAGVTADTWHSKLFGIFRDGKAKVPGFSLEAAGGARTAEDYVFMQRLTQHLASEYGATPSQVQAAMWETVKKVADDKPTAKAFEAGEITWRQAVDRTQTHVATGGFEEAFKTPQVRELYDELVESTKRYPPVVNRTMEYGYGGSGKKGEQFPARDFRVTRELDQALSAPVAERSPILTVSTKPGVLGRDFDLSQQAPRHREALRAMGYDEATRQFTPLSDAGIVHEVFNPEAFGTWNGPEFNFRVRLPGANAERAEFVAAAFAKKLDNMGMHQDAIAITLPDSKVPNIRGVRLPAPDGQAWDAARFESLEDSMAKWLAQNDMEDVGLGLELDHDASMVGFNDFEGMGERHTEIVRQFLDNNGYDSSKLSEFAKDSYLIYRKAPDYDPAGLTYDRAWRNSASSPARRGRFGDVPSTITPADPDLKLRAWAEGGDTNAVGSGPGVASVPTGPGRGDAPPGGEAGVPGNVRSTDGAQPVRRIDDPDFAFPDAAGGGAALAGDNANPRASVTSALTGGTPLRIGARTAAGAAYGAANPDEGESRLESALQYGAAAAGAGIVGRSPAAARIAGRAASEDAPVAQVTATAAAPAAPPARRPPGRRADLFNTVPRAQRLQDSADWQRSVRGRIDHALRNVAAQFGAERQDVNVRRSEVRSFAVEDRTRIENLINSYEGLASEFLGEVQDAGIRFELGNDGNWRMAGSGASFEDMVERSTAAGQAAWNSLTPAQRTAVEQLIEFNGELNANLRHHGAVNRLRWDEFEELYFPRVATGVNGQPFPYIGDGAGGRLGGQGGFEQERVYRIFEDGAAAGVNYARPEQAYRMMVRAKLKVAMDDHLASRLRPLGRTRAELNAMGGNAGQGWVPISPEVAPALNGRFFPPDIAKQILAAFDGKDMVNVRPVKGLNKYLTPFRATGDVSWFMQQGAALMFRHPVKALNASARVIASGFKRDDIYRALIRREEAGGPGLRTLIRDMNLHWVPGELENLDEAAWSPIRGRAQRVGQVTGYNAVSSFSNKTFGRYQNYMRLALANDAHKRITRTAAAQGWDAGKLRRELQGAGAAVNRMSGFTGRKTTSLESHAIFAPKYFSAAVEQVAAMAKWDQEGRIARQHIARMLAIGSTLVVLENARRGYDTEFDPRSSNFMRFRNVGGLDVSPFGTYDTLFRAVAGTLGGQAGGKMKPDVKRLWALVEGKGSPGVRAIYDPFIKGETYAGVPLARKDPTLSGAGRTAYEMGKGSLPFGVANIVEEGVEPAVRGEGFGGFKEMLPGTAASFVGATNTPMSYSERRDFKRDEVAKGRFGMSYDELPGSAAPGEPSKAAVNADPAVEELQAEADRRAMVGKNDAGLNTQQRLEFDRKIQAAGTRLATGEISGSDYRDRYHDAQLILRGSREVLEQFEGQERKDIEGWFALYDQAALPDGSYDRDQLDELQARYRIEHPDIDEQIDSITGTRDDEVLQLFRVAQKQAAMYYDIPAYRGMSLEEGERAGDALRLAQRMTNNRQAANQRHALIQLRDMGLIKPEDVGLALRASRVGTNPERKLFAKEHLEFSLFYRDALLFPGAVPGSTGTAPEPGAFPARKPGVSSRRGLVSEKVAARAPRLPSLR